MLYTRCRTAFEPRDNTTRCVVLKDAFSQCTNDSAHFKECFLTHRTLLRLCRTFQNPLDQRVLDSSVFIYKTRASNDGGRILRVPLIMKNLQFIYYINVIHNTLYFTHKISFSVCKVTLMQQCMLSKKIFAKI